MSNKAIRQLANILPSIPEKDERGRAILTRFDVVGLSEINDEYIGKMRELGYNIKPINLDEMSLSEQKKYLTAKYKKYDTSAIQKTDNFKVLKSFKDDIKKFSDGSELSERTKIVLTGAALKFIQKCLSLAEPNTVDYNKVDELTKKIF